MLLSPTPSHFVTFFPPCSAQVPHRPRLNSAEPVPNPGKVPDRTCAEPYQAFAKGSVPNPPGVPPGGLRNELRTEPSKGSENESPCRTLSGFRTEPSKGSVKGSVQNPPRVPYRVPYRVPHRVPYRVPCRTLQGFRIGLRTQFRTEPSKGSVKGSVQNPAKVL